MPDRLPALPLVAAFGLFLLCAFGLNEIRAHNATYNARDLTLPDGTTARLVLPGPPSDFGLRLPDDMPRPPLAILTHGIIGNKEMMSTIAHHMARHGIAVLTLDWGGHGANPQPFNDFDQRDQLSFAIQFMRERYSHLVDAERIALLGHSMGGGAVMDYAAHFADYDAVIPIAAGWRSPGPVPPRNVLFVYSEQDLPPVRKATPESMSALTGVPDPDHDVTYGRFEDGTARRMVTVPIGVGPLGHIAVISQEKTSREIVAWLGEIWPLGEDRGFREPRMRWVGIVFLGSLALTCVMVRVLRPWLPVLDVQPFDRWPLSLAVLVAVFFLTALILNAGSPFEFVGALGGGYLAAYFFGAGLLLLGYTVATGAADWKWFWPDWRATVGGAVVLALVAWVLFAGASTAGWSRFALPPHRLPLFLWLLGPTALFCVSQDALTKKGNLLGAALMSFGAVVAFTVVCVIAMMQNLMPGILGLVMPILLPLLVVYEIPSLAIFYFTRNYFLSGLFRAIVLSACGAAAWPLY